jgi:hypothetical protein
MKQPRQYRLDFVIDKLTNSIQNTISGDSFQTEISAFTTADLKQTTKKNGWNFNWKQELSNSYREVYKLTIVNNPSIIQGLISLTVKSDHVYLELIESAPFNLGKNKLYEGVAGNLVAFACKVSWLLFFYRKNKVDSSLRKIVGGISFWKSSNDFRYQIGRCISR